MGVLLILWFLSVLCGLLLWVCYIYRHSVCCKILWADSAALLFYLHPIVVFSSISVYFLHDLFHGANMILKFVFFKDLPRSDVLYAYRINGPQDWHQGHRYDYGNLLLDPYAKLIEGRRVFGDASNKVSKFFGTYDLDFLPFDWGENYKLPNIQEVKWTLLGSCLEWIILHNICRLLYMECHMSKLKWINMLFAAILVSLFNWEMQNICC